MCDVEPKLAAWLDRELPTDEAGEVERHLEQCEECRSWAAKYEQVSRTLDAYCDAVMTAKAARPGARWVPVLVGALAAAAVILLAFPRNRAEPRPVVEPTAGVASAAVPASPPAAEATPRKAMIRKRQAAQRVEERAGQGQPMDTAIQIAIPAEAMFPPGAMPNGINFIADVRIAPDGSVRQIRLRQ